MIMVCSRLEKIYSIPSLGVLWSIYTVESLFFEPPRETKVGSKHREFEKSKVAQNHA